MLRPGSLVGPEVNLWWTKETKLPVDYPRSRPALALAFLLRDRAGAPSMQAPPLPVLAAATPAPTSTERGTRPQLTPSGGGSRGSQRGEGGAVATRSAAPRVGEAAAGKSVRAPPLPTPPSLRPTPSTGQSPLSSRGAWTYPPSLSAPPYRPCPAPPRCPLPAASSTLKPPTPPCCPH